MSLGKPMKKPEELLEWGGTKKDSTLPAFSRHMMQVAKINLTISMTLNRYSRAYGQALYTFHKLCTTFLDCTVKMAVV